MDGLQVAAHYGVQHLAHRQHDTAQQDQRLAQLEGAAVHRDVTQLLVLEQVVLELLDRIVERLHRLEVAVHDEVEQPVQQEADAVPGEVRVVVPALDDLADVQAVVLADGDQRVRQHERGHLAGGQLAGGRIEPRAVGGHEQVGVVAVDLRPLPVEQRVLDRDRVQPELLLQHREVAAVRVTQVEPDDRRAVGQVVADPLHRKALGDQAPVLVHPGPGLAPGRGVVADGLGGHLVGVAAVEGHVPWRVAAELPAEGTAAGVGLGAAGVGFSHQVPLVRLVRLPGPRISPPARRLSADRVNSGSRRQLTGLSALNSGELSATVLITKYGSVTLLFSARKTYCH